MIIRSHNIRYITYVMVTGNKVTTRIMHIYKVQKSKILIFLAYREYEKFLLLCYPTRQTRMVDSKTAVTKR